MIFRRHVRHRIAAWGDGEVSPREAARIEAHLAGCEACRRAADAYRDVAQVMRRVTRQEAPPAVWSSIESVLRQHTGGQPQTSVHTGRHPRRGLFTTPNVTTAVATLCLLAVAVAAALWWSTLRTRPWDVVRVDDAAETRLSAGSWVETGPQSGASLRVGQIGHVDVAPQTRLQVLTASAAEQRLNLVRGRISVEIVAPPRVFFVNTPASTVVDLGCAYTMDVGADGSGSLQVTAGWVSLEWDERESFVPAGASATTRPSQPPGTPAFDDASPALRNAVAEFDYGRNKAAALSIVLDEARSRDTLTLWHLMSRVAQHERPRVLDRAIALTPLPAGLSRDRLLALDAPSMLRWREELAWTW